MFSQPTDIFFLALLLAVFGGTSAEAFGAEHNVMLPLRDFKLLTGQFRQTKVFKDMDVTLSTEGHFKISRQSPEASVIHWDIESPKPTKICIDTTGIMIDGGSQSKNLNFAELSKDTAEQVSGLLKLMTMDAKQLGEHFDIQKDASKNTGKGAAKNDFLLKAHDPKMQIFDSAGLSLNSAGMVESILLKEKTGDEIKIQFSQLKIGDPAGSDKACSRP